MAKCLLCARTSPPFEFDANGLCPNCAVREERKAIMCQEALRRYKEMGQAFVSIMTSGKDDVCDVCKTFPNRPYTIDSAPKLPAHIGCRCCYAPWTYLDKKKWYADHPEDVAAMEAAEQQAQRNSHGDSAPVSSGAAGIYCGPGISLLRHPNAVALRPMAEHDELHDLSDADPEELRLLHLLMRLAGNFVGYERSGVTSILYPDVSSDIGKLRARGYLCEPLPLAMLMDRLTVPDIKELLRAHGLPLGGKRAELVERISPVLTTDEIAALREKFAFWLPSDYGYEMLYSYYVQWELREWALVNAIANNNITRITAAMEALQSCYPKCDGMCLDVNHIKHALQTLNGKRASSAIQIKAIFEIIAGIPPTFWFHNPNWAI